MICKRGDVVLVRYPNSDMQTFKKRPALVVQADHIETGLAQKLVALITTNLQRTGETRLFVSSKSAIGQQMGLINDSMIVADNLATVRDFMIDKVIGNCIDMSAVDAALKKALQLD